MEATKHGRWTWDTKGTGAIGIWAPRVQGVLDLDNRDPGAIGIQRPIKTITQKHKHVKSTEQQQERTLYNTTN